MNLQLEFIGFHLNLQLDLIGVYMQKVFCYLQESKKNQYITLPKNEPKDLDQTSLSKNKPKI